MGYHQNIIVSSLLDKAAREHAIQSARSRWPFLRSPRQGDVYSERLLLALPELTEYLFDTDAEYWAAVEQSELVESELRSWSQDFPNTSFTYIRADCIGGACLYDGFVCREGAILDRVEPSRYAHVSLLRHVGILTDGAFEPFTRVFFEGHWSGAENLA
jgi:hypothetical protein